MAAASDGQADEALALAREHLPTARDFGQLELSTSLYRAAYVLAHAGRAEAAATVLGRADAIGDEIGAASGWMREFNEQTCQLARTDLGERAFAEASERGRALTTDEALELAQHELASGAEPV